MSEELNKANHAFETEKINGVKGALKSLWEDECWDEQKVTFLMDELQSLTEERGWKQSDPGEKCRRLFETLMRIFAIVFAAMIYHALTHSSLFIPNK